MHLLHPRRARHPGTVYTVFVLFSLLAFSLGGCRSSQGPTAGQQALMRIQQGPDAEKNEAGLHRVAMPESQGILFIKAPRPHLEQFDRIVLDPVELHYGKGIQPWSPRTEERLRDSFVDTLTDRLEDQNTWQMTEARGSGVLVMRIAARDLSVNTGLPHVSSSRYSYAQRRGTTTLVMELYDSETNELLVQFKQHRTLPAGFFSGSNVEVERLRVSFGRFATSMGENLAELAQAVEDVRKDDERGLSR